MPTPDNVATLFSPTDGKVLVRTMVGPAARLTENRPTLPTTAMVIGNAAGFDGNRTGVYAHSERSMALYAKSTVYAGWFDGDVTVAGNFEVESGRSTFADVTFAHARAASLTVSGDIFMANADCAEDFDILCEMKVEAGTVMVLGADGSLTECREPYDRKVVGVISGAGRFKPGIVMDKRESANNRQPVALMGKVFCKVEASFGPIAVGDLLTTSAEPGHAMRAGDPTLAFGAVIGKALEPCPSGRGLIAVLIALQ